MLSAYGSDSGGGVSGNSGAGANAAAIAAANSLQRLLGVSSGAPAGTGVAGSPSNLRQVGASPHLLTSSTIGPGYEIRDVWAKNFDAELDVIRKLVLQYPYVSMDTEFPGVVARPVGSFNSKSDFHFQTVRCNVDLLNIIQIGLTFCNEQGELPPGCACWQFNFQFSLQDDMYSQDSVDLLQRSGIDFQRFEREGIDRLDFGEKLLSSGLVLEPGVHWISFHSGYDFGYLLKLLTCAPLPAEEDGFFDLLHLYFPCIYDIKYLMLCCRPLRGGLQDLADDLDVERHGPQHQAGSDSLLTAGTFFRLVELFFERDLDNIKFNGFLYGLSGAAAANAYNSGSSSEKSNVSVASHTCLHDVHMEQQRDQGGGEADSRVQFKDLHAHQQDALRVHFDHIEKKRQEPQWEPLRVHLDFSHLIPSNDPLGLCYQKGNWAILGDPTSSPVYSQQDHKPLCSPECGTAPKTTNNPKGGCNCWYQCEEEDTLWQQRRDFLVDHLFPQAKQWLEAAIKVRRMPLALHPQTQCQCGNDKLNLDTAKEFGRVVRTSYGNATHPYTAADLVMFVTVRSTRLRGADTLAFACSCQDDWYGRPVFGAINWGANAVDYQNKDKFKEQLGVALHEITHVLGFSNNKYNDYYLDNAKLEQMIQQGKMSWPPNHDSEQRSPRLPASAVTEQRQLQVDVAGTTVQHTVQLLITPNAVAQAQLHYGCNTMDGLELENGGSSGTAASHFEKRLFENEYMTGSATYNPRRSKIALGFLEDMGYYQVDYEQADSFTFGRQEGCDFVGPRCDKWAGPYRCGIDEQSHWGCIWDRTARGLCTVFRHSEDLPLFNQYFPTQPDYGGSSLSDYCPFYRYEENLNADCTEPLHQANNYLDRAEIFSPSSRCFDSNLLSVTKMGLLGSAGCHPVQCKDGKVWVRILNEFYECSANFEIKIPNYSGRFKCPPTVELTALCDGAPKSTADDWPTVTGVSPAGGRFKTGDLVTVQGTKLVKPSVIYVGTYKCTDMQNGTNSDTSVTCKFGAVTTVDNEEPPPSSSNAWAGFLDLFTSSGTAAQASDLVDVTVELESGLIGNLKGGFDNALDSSAADVACHFPNQLLVALFLFYFI